jgi:hypothetical protein
VGDSQGGGAVKSTYNLEDFVRCSHLEGRLGPTVPYFRVGKKGMVTISAGVGMEIPANCTVDILCNKVGTVVVLKVIERRDGATFKPAPRARHSWVSRSTALARHLEKCRVNIPAVFLVERNEAEGFWIGKLQK